MGGLPKILDFFQDRSDKSHELQLAKMQSERELALAERGFVAQARIEEIRTDQVAMQTAVQERQALYAHDIEIGKGASQWVVNIRALVRPLITYGMFLMLLFVNIFGFFYAWKTGVPFEQAMEILWDEDSAIIFSSVIAFWFGTQSFKK
jgi:predicted DCC family thiol-disulfide oxidoreductase YuxK